jgi:hypothetical protein
MLAVNGPRLWDVENSGFGVGKFVLPISSASERR